MLISVNVCNEIKYVLTVQESSMMEFLRMSGMYWGLTALYLINNGKIPKEDEIFEYITSCENNCGGYSPAPGHDPHLLYTLSAVQVSIMIVWTLNNYFTQHFFIL